MKLERLFGELVNAIRASDPSSLHQPHRLRDIQYDLVPYRSVRHTLKLSCSEDHEMLLLRLCAGEGDYFALADADARRAFSEEAVGVNADLGLLQVYGDIEVRLEERAINRSMTDLEQDSTYRPLDVAPSLAQDQDDDPTGADIEDTDEDLGHADEETEATSVPEPYAAPLTEATSVPEPDAGPLVEPPSPSFEIPPGYESPASEAATPAQQCAYCGGSLPSNRQANFCPHCGQDLTVIRCAQCTAELEYGWRHCIVCGHPVPDA